MRGRIFPQISPFITSMQKLADQNMAERQPSKVIEFLFHSHPSIGKRIAAAESWASKQQQPAALSDDAPVLTSSKSSTQRFFHPLQVLFRVDAHRVERRLGHVDRDAMIQEA